MAQTPIREYDAKKLLSAYLGEPYLGTLLTSAHDIANFLAEGKWVIKPDQLFGKRGKHGLVGVNLDAAWVRAWANERFNTTVTIDGRSGKLHTFLVEPFVPHTQEYYVAISAERTADRVYFSQAGGVDIEDNWESVKHLDINVQTTPTAEIFSEVFGIPVSSPIASFLVKLVTFVREYGFAYYEINPFAFGENGSLVYLDSVARLDSCEAFRQVQHWQDITFVQAFGEEKTEAEARVEELDANTGASLKLRVLNPTGRIWLLTSGGGASVIVADSIARLGFGAEIANYGECSGNPDRENTREYTRALLGAMIQGNQPNSYLVIAWGIANFTHVDKTFAGIVDALEEYAEDLKRLGITILVRRGGINDTKGLALLKRETERLGLTAHMADGNIPLTDILTKIQL